MDVFQCDRTYILPSSLETLWKPIIHGVDAACPSRIPCMVYRFLIALVTRRILSGSDARLNLSLFS